MDNPIDVVRNFCAAWTQNRPSHELAAFFTEDATYFNMPLEPVMGRKQIEAYIDSFIRPGKPDIEAIDFRIVNMVAEGSIVLTERVDIFTVGRGSFELPVMGVFELVDGKIKAWRDYFDVGQFTDRRAEQGGSQA